MSGKVVVVGAAVAVVDEGLKTFSWGTSFLEAVRNRWQDLPIRGQDLRLLLWHLKYVMFYNAN